MRDERSLVVFAAALGQAEVSISRPSRSCRGFAGKVVRTPKAIEFFGIDPVSFTPGFSQVNCAKLRFGNRLNGFPPAPETPITRLKPGVNENLDVLLVQR